MIGFLGFVLFFVLVVVRGKLTSTSNNNKTPPKTCKSLNSQMVFIAKNMMESEVCWLETQSMRK